jgi:ketosteroid isomerase-like protein
MTATLVLALAIVQQGGAVAEITRELTAFERRLAATWKAGDCTGWAAMLADDWSVIHITGTVMSKAEALQMCNAPTAPITTFDVDDIAVRPFGDAAVVTGRTRVAIGGTDPAEVTLRFTDVFIRRGGRWQVVASHATRLGS